MRQVYRLFKPFLGVAVAGVYLTFLFAASQSHAAEIVSRILTSPKDSAAKYRLQQKYPVGLVEVSQGDRLLFKVGGQEKYAFLVSESKTSKSGNSILRGVTKDGGRALMVFSPDGGVTGHFQSAGGMRQITSDEYGVITVWEEGVDTLPTALGDDAVLPDENEPLEFSPKRLRQLQSDEAVQTQKFEPEDTGLLIGYPRFPHGHAVVSVLIYYRDTMEDYIGRLADFLIEITNDAFSDSEVDLSLEIAEFMPVELDEDATTYEILDDMKKANPPFTQIEVFRGDFSADLVATFTDAYFTSSDPSIDSQGIAQLGDQFAVSSLSVTRYPGYQPGQAFYSSYTFAHEIGHNLGAKHNRGEYTEEEQASDLTFSYAYGYQVPDSHKSIMSYGAESRAPLFSNPNINYGDAPLGVPFLAQDSADVSRAFTANRHRAAANRNSGKDYAAAVNQSVFFYDSDCGRDLEEGEPEGRARSLFISFGASLGLEVHSSHRIRPDGSDYMRRYPTGITLGVVADCTFPDEAPNPLGTDYVESYFWYRNTETGELFESAHVKWEEDYEGPYREVRIAHSDGGALVGNPSLLLKEGEEHIIEFQREAGFKLARINSTCGGERSGDSFAITTTRDDCRVEAIFEDAGVSQRAQDQFTNLLGLVQNPDQFLPPEPSIESKFLGTYHIYRTFYPGRENVLRIGENSSLSLGSNTGWYRWELQGEDLDVYYMFDADAEDEAVGEYSFTLALGEEEGAVEVIERNSTLNAFYGERVSVSSEYLFDLYELGKAYDSSVWECFNIGSGEFPYGNLPYGSSVPPATSTDLEECQSLCPAVLAWRKDTYPDNENVQAETCESDE